MVKDSGTIREIHLKVAFLHDIVKHIGLSLKEDITLMSGKDYGKLISADAEDLRYLTEILLEESGTGNDISVSLCMTL